ncbi:uncharacterized protein LOC127250005 [Andrographis paniculata]|uniref:uncharacterized protein LOC127250005 n=1 Tax=Andrographis paniculata TaxID=175694 RepID=UPI0021E72221|nr:uncharacterized protein LOC127250005 [Andrographis paniculata]
MRSFSILSSSNSLFCSGYYAAFLPPGLFPRKWINPAPKPSSSGRFPLISLQIHRFPCFAVRSTGTQEVLETDSSALGFVETGYISGVHGLQGEVRVKPSTDFPDLRFSKPGKRWLKQRNSGTETLQEIELIEGRGHGGQKWIVKFGNIDTVEQAQKLVGSTILVPDEDKPDLEEGEFYTRDLIGMTVVLKESGELVGTVDSVYKTGAHDLLHVRLNSLRNIPNRIGKMNISKDNLGPLVWVPFVEAIVPTVDLEKREMLITPPKGLLELNVRSDERSKKERRELEWKERKKFQRRVIAAKKKLYEMEQKHVFDGVGYGGRDKARLLANQIASVNSNLLQQALQNIETPLTRPNLLDVLSAVPGPHRLSISDEPYCKLQRKGHLLNSDGKIAVCVVLGNTADTENGSAANFDNSDVKSILDDHASFIQVEGRQSVPLILVCAAGSVSSLQELFWNDDFFGFDPEKVWFLEEEKLPVVSSSIEGHGKHKILMKSPWEFLQRSVGSGGLISLLSSQESLLDHLSETGIEYFEVGKINRNHEKSHALLGLLSSCSANVGINLFEGITVEEDFNIIFTMSFVRKLIKQLNKLHFRAILTRNSYVQKIEKEWVDVIPSEANSYEFRASIYGCLDATPINKVCVLDSNL